MDKRALFTETLTSFVEFAAAKGNEITQEDVVLYFKDLIEDESQYQFIYDYLAVNKIKVKGWKNTSATETLAETSDSDVDSQASVETEEELSFIKIYMDEINAIPPLHASEKQQLISELLSGNLDVVNRLVEAHLSVVAELAEKHRGQGVTFGDLIQEGNMGLMLALSEYNSQSGDFDVFIKDAVNKYLKDTINIQVNSNRVSQHLADKLNQLDTATKNLSEKLGRVPELKELAQEMGISEDEASLLLKTSLDTLSVNEDTQITSDENNPEGNEDSIYTAPQEDPLQWRVNQK